MKKVLILCTFILCLFFLKVTAQTGCVKYYYPGFDVVYYQRRLRQIGTFGPAYGGVPAAFPVGCRPVEPTPFLSNSGECSLRNPITGYYDIRGLLVENHLECPIDTYLPFFVLLASCLGAGFVRNRMVFGLIG
ncbi:hypothetical protein [Pedobacter borealis]|uniref:hypothetical protein n=1 Tax=Pedobacter borealis TaxID=475254 RepID=UPI0004932EFA|nr:hypothetical protein [Pedobacter borealis]